MPFLMDHSLIPLTTDETLIRLSAVRAIDSPSPQELNGFYQEWLKRPERGNGFLSGSDRYIWRDKSVHEMVTLHRRALDDPFSSFLGSKLINVYHWVRKRLNISKKVRGLQLSHPPICT